MYYNQFQGLYQGAMNAAEAYARGYGARDEANANDGGQFPDRQKVGTIEAQDRSSLRPRKRKRTKNEKIEWSYRMVKDLMPRMKYVGYRMFDQIFQVDQNYRDDSLTSKFSDYQDNTATLLTWPAFSNKHLGTGWAETRITAGHSLTVTEDQDRRTLVANAVFPMSHPALINIGDDYNERLTDYVQLYGVHLTGFVESFLTFPTYDDEPTAEIMYGAHGPLRPTTARLNNNVKLRLMLIETFGPQQDITVNTDPVYYRNADWPPSARGAPQLLITGAPRLHHILDVAGNVDGSGSEVVDSVYNNRWNYIDRKYRRNDRSSNLWKDPNKFREVEFHVLYDRAIKLDDPGVTISRGQGSAYYDPQTGMFKPKCRVNIDAFVKFKDMKLSYESNVDQQTATTNASRQLYWYLFDDSVDYCGDSTTSQQPVNSGTINNELWTIADEVVSRGGARSRAYINGVFYYDDDL